MRSLLPPTGSRSRNAKVAQPDMPGFGEVPSERTAEMPGGEHHLPTEAWHGNNWMGLLCGRLDREKWAKRDEMQQLLPAAHFETAMKVSVES